MAYVVSSAHACVRHSPRVAEEHHRRGGRAEVPVALFESPRALGGGGPALADVRALRLLAHRGELEATQLLLESLVLGALGGALPEPWRFPGPRPRRAPERSRRRRRRRGGRGPRQRARRGKGRARDRWTTKTQGAVRHGDVVTGLPASSAPDDDPQNAPVLPLRCLISVILACAYCTPQKNAVREELKEDPPLPAAFKARWAKTRQKNAAHKTSRVASEGEGK